MQGLSEHQLLLMLLAIAVLLGAARGAGEAARRLHQPEVLGELFAGFVLGPSLLGTLAPWLYQSLFLSNAVGLGLSVCSWIGAVLLLLLAGFEVDLASFARQAKPGILASTGAIVPSLAVGLLFTALIGDQQGSSGFFFGIVLSVTAVSVVSKILIERAATRRDYAQILMACGITSEVLCWVLVSVVIAVIPAVGSLPLPLAIARSVLVTTGFFMLMLTFGRRLIFWSMRRVADATGIAWGRFSLVVVITFLAAALTQELGLHALLGAFVVGVLLRQAPRANEPLLRSVQTVTMALFAPLFFAEAGMRVDLSQLGGPGALTLVGLLLVISAGTKILFSTLGARLGGLANWDALLVGVGLNLKGGTDVIVAIVGVELGLLSNRLYTLYAVVAMLTVLVSPVLMTRLERRAPPSPDEARRLAEEEAQRSVYLSGIERVLIPLPTSPAPAMAAEIVTRIGETKQAHHQIFDLTQVPFPAGESAEPVSFAQAAYPVLTELSEATPRRKGGAAQQEASGFLEAARSHGLVILGTRLPQTQPFLSFGSLHDQLLHHMPTDVLLVVSAADSLLPAGPMRVLVPFNGMAHALAALDVAAYVASGSESEIVLLQVVREGTRARLRSAQRQRAGEGEQNTAALAARLAHVGVSITPRRTSGRDAGECIVRELERAAYHLVVLGTTNRGTPAHPYLGETVHAVLSQTHTPALVLVCRNPAATGRERDPG
jgi:Kef-type K+ transport system membrane component KefB/nucleotide-binding universal stress UspA family protein